MSQYFSRKNTLLFGGAVIFFLLGYTVSQAWGKTLIIKAKVLRETGHYTSPVLLCNINPNQSYNEDQTLSKILIAEDQRTPQSDISAYFLSLSGGGWASVNENETYSPASMLKVPSVVEALKYAEIKPSILSQTVYYDGSFDNNKAETFKASESIQAGRSYTIDELINRIITYSDNNALLLLHQTLNQNSFQELYKALGIEIPENSIDFMSAKTYSLFLRVLYNATYLSADNSEKVLKLMANSDFPDGLKAGVPASVEIAHKFGEREVYNENGTLVSRELHDCGIVYIPNNPYILCVMTRGQDWNALQSSIQEVSKLVYDHVTK